MISLKQKNNTHFSLFPFLLFSLHFQSVASHFFTLDISNEDTKKSSPLLVDMLLRLRIHLCGLSGVEIARCYRRSLKCTRATSVYNLKLSCHLLAKLYGAFIMFPATVTRKLLGPKPGSPVKTGEINPSAEAAAWAKSLFPFSSLGSQIALSFSSYISYYPHNVFLFKEKV